MQFNRLRKKPAHGTLAKHIDGLSSRLEATYETELAFWQEQEKNASGTDKHVLKEQAGEFVRHLGNLIKFRDGALPPSVASGFRAEYRRKAQTILAISKLGAIMTSASVTLNRSQEEGSGWLFEFPTDNEHTGTISDARLHMTSSWIDELVGPPKTGAQSTWYQASDRSLYVKRTTEATLEPAFVASVMEQQSGTVLPLESMQTLFPYLPKV